MSIAVDQWPKRHLIDVEQYYKMAEVGLLAPDARVELIEGEIIEMAPIGPSHAGATSILTQSFTSLRQDRAIVRVQLPVRLGATSEPQPDIALVKPRADHYRSSHPTATDVLLIVEVSDATLKFDRGEKLALYAKHGIPEVWVVDLVNKQLHCMRYPDNGRYSSMESLNATQYAKSAALPDIRFQLGELLR